MGPEVRGLLLNWRGKGTRKGEGGGNESNGGDNLRKRTAPSGGSRGHDQLEDTSVGGEGKEKKKTLAT